MGQEGQEGGTGAGEGWEQVRWAIVMKEGLEGLCLTCMLWHHMQSLEVQLLQDSCWLQETGHCVGGSLATPVPPSSLVLIPTVLCFSLHCFSVFHQHLQSKCKVVFICTVFICTVFR